MLSPQSAKYKFWIVATNTSKGFINAIRLMGYNFPVKRLYVILITKGNLLELFRKKNN
jgi:hypothetical protein